MAANVDRDGVPLEGAKTYRMVLPVGRLDDHLLRSAATRLRRRGQLGADRPCQRMVPATAAVIAVARLLRQAWRAGEIELID